MKKQYKIPIATALSLMLSMALFLVIDSRICKNEEIKSSNVNTINIEPATLISEKVDSRTDLINYLIKENELNDYLEIGLNNPFFNFTKIDCKNKISVDPYLTDGQDLNTEEM